jgi:sugar phosphate isomerase/epimerase
VRRRSIRTALVAGLLAAATIAGACGGDDGSASGADDPEPTTTVGRDAWSDSLDEACAELNRDYGQLAAADPSNRDEAIAYAREVDEFAADLVAALSQAGVPSGDRDDADALADLVDELAVAAADLVEAAEDGDVAGANRATEQLERIGVDINAASAELDVPSCGGF